MLIGIFQIPPKKMAKYWNSCWPARPRCLPPWPPSFPPWPACSTPPWWRPSQRGRTRSGGQARGSRSPGRAQKRSRRGKQGRPEKKRKENYCFLKKKFMFSCVLLRNKKRKSPTVTILMSFKNRSCLSFLHFSALRSDINCCALLHCNATVPRFTK